MAKITIKKKWKSFWKRHPVAMRAWRTFIETLTAAGIGTLATISIDNMHDRAYIIGLIMAVVETAAAAAWNQIDEAWKEKIEESEIKK